MKVRSFVPLLLSLALTACLGGGGGGSGESTAAVAATDATSVAPTPAPGGQTSVSTGTSASGATSLPSSSGLYDRAPIIDSCDAGLLKMSDKQAVLTELNAVRALHRLPPVIYDSSADIYTQKSALIGVANAQLTHTPAPNMICFSDEGAQGSGQSNLFLAGGYTPTSAESIARFLIDDNVASLGHRRWVLHPFLSQTSFGRVDGQPRTGSTLRHTATSLRVLGYPDANLAGHTDLNYVAYPEGIYPAKYFKHGWFMSFSVLANRGSTFANGQSAVSFNGATIQVANASGAALTISDQSANHAGFGLPNVVQWKVTGTQNNVEYTVRIGNVTVGGQARSYQYTFKIVP